MSKKPAPTADAVAEEIAEAVFTEAISSYSTAPLDPEKEDLQKQVELLTQQAVAAEDRHKRERNEWKAFQQGMQAENEALHRRNMALEQADEKRRIAREQLQKRRLATVPKLVIASLVALAMLVIPYMLQTLSVIGPQLSYTIQSGLFMAIAWCMALIWERAGK